MADLKTKLEEMPRWKRFGLILAIIWLAGLIAGSSDFLRYHHIQLYRIEGVLVCVLGVIAVYLLMWAFFRDTE